MKRWVVIVVIALIFGGCSYFSASKRLQECDELLVRSEEQLMLATMIIDSLEAENNFLKQELEQCQKSKNLELRRRSF